MSDSSQEQDTPQPSSNVMSHQFWQKEDADAVAMEFKDGKPVEAFPGVDPKEILIFVVKRNSEPINQTLFDSALEWVEHGFGVCMMNDPFGGWISITRNWVSRVFLGASQFKYLMLIDADVHVRFADPYRLARHNLPITSGIYFSAASANGGLFGCVQFAGEDGKNHFINTHNCDDLPNSGLKEIEGAGCGCLMIRRDVLEKLWGKYAEDWSDIEKAVDTIDAMAGGHHEPVEYEQLAILSDYMRNPTVRYGAPFDIPVWAHEHAVMTGKLPMGEDIAFIRRAKELGFQSYVDFEVQCLHDKCFPIGWPSELSSKKPVTPEWGLKVSGKEDAS